MTSLADVRLGGKRKREDSNTDRRHESHARQQDSHSRYGRQRDTKAWNNTEQAKLNQLQEEEQHREYLAQEGSFVLKQKRKASEIRVKEGRAKPIDWLTITLQIIDPTRDLINDDEGENEFEFVSPESVFDSLTEAELHALERDIEDFIDLERNPKNRDYWKTMEIICKDKKKKIAPRGREDRSVSSVSSDIDSLLGPKTYEELVKLERQVRTKLDSDEPVDTDYWQHLLDSLLVWKAKARLKKVYEAVINTKFEKLRQENEKIAMNERDSISSNGNAEESRPQLQSCDPVPLLQVDVKDKGMRIIDEQKFLSKIASDRRRILKMRYVPLPEAVSDRNRESKPLSSSFQLPEQEVKGGVSNKVSSAFDHEVAKGVEEDEEVFAGEEDIETQNKDLWSGKYRPRKPKYFNRVQMGYEWNKYNQTHYDHDNPPPKVVQGYKFHIFYPELIDKYKAPTYKIMRDDGRKKGQTIAPAGEEDTCIIRFISGPPYEDIAFRIVDRDWDYSAKHDRGFKSTFENGVLSLHFSFKKVYYRK